MRAVRWTRRIRMSEGVSGSGRYPDDLVANVCFVRSVTSTRVGSCALSLAQECSENPRRVRRFSAGLWAKQSLSLICYRAHRTPSGETGGGDPLRFQDHRACILGEIGISSPVLLTAGSQTVRQIWSLHPAGELAGGAILALVRRQKGRTSYAHLRRILVAGLFAALSPLSNRIAAQSAISAALSDSLAAPGRLVNEQVRLGPRIGRFETGAAGQAGTGGQRSEPCENVNETASGVRHPSRLRAFRNFSGVSDFRAQDVALQIQLPPRPGGRIRLSALL